MSDLAIFRATMSPVCPAGRYGQDGREEAAVHDPVSTHLGTR